MLDMVQPKEEGRIRLQDLKSCSLTPIFFDTFINLDKYLEHEQKDPFSGIRVMMALRMSTVSDAQKSRDNTLMTWLIAQLMTLWLEMEACKPVCFYQYS